MRLCFQARKAFLRSHFSKYFISSGCESFSSNRAYCTEHGIRISGPALGRQKKESQEDKKQAYIDNIDRIEVERAFSLSKRRFGLGLITTKLDSTTRSSIALSILAMNVDRLTAISFAQILISIFSR